MSLAVHKSAQRGMLGAFSVFLVKLYGFILSVAFITCLRHPYIGSLTHSVVGIKLLCWVIS